MLQSFQSDAIDECEEDTKRKENYDRKKKIIILTVGISDNDSNHTYIEKKEIIDRSKQTCFYGDIYVCCE